MKYVIQLILCLHLLGPVLAWSQDTAPRDPLSYPIKTYVFMLGFAIFGGLVSFYSKVRRGEVEALSLMQLVGEIATSAFAGLLVFYLCEYLQIDQMLTAPLVGISGHMGAKVITIIEDVAKRRAASKLGGSQ
jgi:hypothetical protein